MVFVVVIWLLVLHHSFTEVGDLEGLSWESRRALQIPFPFTVTVFSI